MVKFFLFYFLSLFQRYDFIFSGNAIIGEDIPFSIFYNPVILSDKFSLGGQVSWIYSIPKLYNLVMSFSSKGIFGAGFSQFGDDEYQEKIILFALNYKIKSLKFGISVKFLNLFINDFCNKWNATFDIGFLIYSDSVKKFTFSFQNLYSPKFYHSTVNKVLNFSMSYKFSRNVSFTLDIVSEEKEKIEFINTAFFKVYNKLYLISGLSVNPNFYNLGFKLRLFNLGLFYVVKFHNYLNPTYNIGVVKLW